MHGQIPKVLVACFLGLMPVASRGQQTAAQPVGVVSHVKVLSDKVPDVSSMEAWKKSFIREGMDTRRATRSISSFGRANG